MDFPDRLKELARALPDMTLAERWSTNKRYHCTISISESQPYLLLMDFTNIKTMVGNRYGGQTKISIPDDCLSKTDFTFKDICEDAIKEAEKKALFIDPKFKLIPTL